MNQQINLYQPIFRKQAKVFSATTILQICGIFVLALMLIYAYSFWQSTLLERQVAQLQSQLQAGTVKLNQLETNLPSNKVDPGLQLSLKKAMAQHDLKQRAVIALSQRSYGITSGFSSQLTGLARQHVTGLWLTGIRLSQGGAQFSLNGETTQPALVPAYLRKLTNEPVFKGTEFGLLRIDRPKKNHGNLAFHLTTALTDKSEKGEADVATH